MEKFFKNKRRKGFTLVELLAVMGIVMILAAVIIAIQPGNPQGLRASLDSAIGIFRGAKLRATSTENPDRNPDTNKFYNIRSRVLVLNDPGNQDEHLRLLRVIVGGTRTQDATDTANYFWYVTDIDTVLPSGTYYVEPDETSLQESRRSRITNRDGGGRTMRLNYNPTVIAQAEGSGDREWYYYEFNHDGTSNMFAASFMISEGDWDPANKKVIFRNKENVTGFVILPNGNVIPFTDPDELEKGNVAQQ